MKPTKNKNCKNCLSCYRVYGIWWYIAGKMRYLYCSVRDELTDPENLCPQWQRKKAVAHLPAQRFDKAEEDIRAIAQYAQKLFP